MIHAAQRSTPMVIVHGKNDQVVNASVGKYAYNRLLSHNFHNVKFLNPSSGHPYDFLPVDEAIEYLDALTNDSSYLLLKYTEKMVAKKDWRTVGLALKRAKELDEDKDFADIRKSFEEKASKQAARHLKDLKKGTYGKWVDRFLRWHEDFALAESATDVLKEWDALVEVHSEAAKPMATEARKAFNAGKGGNFESRLCLSTLPRHIIALSKAVSKRSLASSTNWRRNSDDRPPTVVHRIHYWLSSSKRAISKASFSSLNSLTTRTTPLVSIKKFVGHTRTPHSTEGTVLLSIF